MINKRIRQARLISGMTQSEVVSKLKVQGIKLTKAGLSKYERGGSIPSPKILLKLSKVLSVKTKPGSRLQFERTFFLRALSEHTEIVDEWKLDTGRNRIVEKIATPTMKQAIFENIAKLKELMEVGHTILQNGKVSKLRD